MGDDDALQAIRILASSLRDLQRQAAQLYLPVVEGILRSRCRDTQHIEHTLDGLLDFCGDEPVLRLYKDLCRYYWDIDPAAVAYHVNSYRERWDSDVQEGQA